MSKKPKLVLCRKCNTAIEKKAKVCPACGAKNKKPIYKRWWFLLLAIIIVVSVLTKKDEPEYDESPSVSTEIEEQEMPETKPTPEPEATPEPEPTPEPAPAPQPQPEPAPQPAAPAGGIRPEFKQAMDSYESFMNEYCTFMNKYAQSGGTDLGMLADYTKYMKKYTEFVKDFEAWDSQELSNEEAIYYLEVQNRITQKLLEVQ